MILIIQINILPFIGEILNLIQIYWDKNLSNLLEIIKSCYISLKDQFKLYLPTILPLLISVLQCNSNKDPLVNVKPKINISGFSSNRFFT